MYPTAEVRWFYGGSIPPIVSQWFQLAGEKSVSPDFRVDYYLCLPANEALGIKLRDGRFEVKRRERRPDLAFTHKRAEGFVEYWVKWSYDPDTAPQNIPELAQPVAKWIAVKKNRWLRRFAVEVEDGLIDVGPGISIDRGCELEITNIAALSKAWWTVAFEAFGPAETLLQDLHKTATWVFNIGRPPALAASASMGYPAWLLRLMQSG